jgi:PBP1b-binding outer membrane lipoprotein LpoB
MKKLLLILTITLSTFVLMGCSKSSKDENTKQANYKDLNQQELMELKTKADKYQWTEKQKKSHTQADWKDEPIK